MEGQQSLNVRISRVLYFIANVLLLLFLLLLFLLLQSAFAALPPLRLCWYMTTVAIYFPLPTLPFLPSLEVILSDL
jgi:hypothetical protein